MKAWNQDAFSRRARQENQLARSVYKLEEIDKRTRVLDGAKTIVDLGASPGSWTEYCVKKLPHAQITAVDLQPLRTSHPRVRFYQQSIETVEWETLLPDRSVDVVLSDMAPNTSGVHDRDVALSYELVRLALATAKRLLKPGGRFVCKVFMGEDFKGLESEIRPYFSDLRILRPESIRKQSREVYFCAKGFAPRATVEDPAISLQ